MNLTPALDLLIGDRAEHNRDYGPGSGSCVDCPFAGLLSRYTDIATDPAEADYFCSLLNRKVWGENPECDWENWRECARLELLKHYQAKSVTPHATEGLRPYILGESNS